MDSLKVIATWVLSSGGAGVLGFWAVNRVPWPETFSAELKRYLAFVATGIIAVAIWALATWTFSEPFPATPQEWVAKLVGIVATAITTSQIAHAATGLRARDRAMRAAMSGDDVPEM